MKYLMGLIIAAALCGPPAAVAAEGIPGNWSTDPVDKAACQRHLNVIYGAVQEYQKRKQQMPRWLSDLVPEFIHDANVLKCPFVERTGNLKKYRDQYVSVPVFGDSAACSYAYEFCTEPIPAIPGM